MYVKQISVFIENTSGKLANFARLLGENGIDMMSLSVADTTNFGILRCIVADYEKAAELLRQNGYTVRVTDVLAVPVQDAPGGLAKILESLSQNEIAVEYLYSFVRRSGNSALIIFRVDDGDKAVQVLKQAGVKMLSQDEVRAL